MQPGIRFREPARVVMHLNEGLTKVVLERTLGVGMANGGAYWDIPTDRIPLHLRTIGSRFLVISQAIRPEPHDSIDAIRAAIDDLVVEELKISE